MQKVSDIIPYFRLNLKGIADDREIISWGYITIGFLLEYTRSDVIIYGGKFINKTILLKIESIVQELKLNKPIQYILGKTNLYGLDIKVNQYTLIPRPETEELVSWILQENFNSVIDIGTGSGCIAISLAKNSGANISAIDISDNALKVAKESATLNDLDINFIHADILEIDSLSAVDVIVSNPPYVLESDKLVISKRVIEYEPHLALFVDNKNPFLFYQKITELAKKSLNSSGKLYFEINEHYSNDITRILDDNGFVDIQLKKDINDKDRMIRAIKK